MVRSARDKSYQQPFTTERQTGHTSGIMVYVGIMYIRKTPLFRISGRPISQRYVDLVIRPVVRHSYKTSHKIILTR